MPFVAVVGAALLSGLTPPGSPGPSEPGADTHWSFRPPVRPTPPALAAHARRDWVRNPIDAFVLDRLTREGTGPAPEADRATLIRRLSFDLTGLPPTPAEVDAFVNDPSADAHAALVERLLGSPHYGEKWGRHWLDVVRYGETEGFEYDRHRAGTWRYRDYVVRSFNADKPYDRFVVEQVAGDEVGPGDRDLLVAAGFHRLGPVRRNAGNPETAFSRHEVLTEMADAVGSAFLGLTVGCARCHDHKFDPIAIDEYYEFQAFWAAAREHEEYLAAPAEVATWKADTARIRQDITKLKATFAGLSGEALAAARTRVADLERTLPPPPPSVTTVRNDWAAPEPVRVLKRGNTDRPSREVAARLFAAACGAETPAVPADARDPRTRLARAIASPENPLTARVMVNRVWQGHFGVGLVDTANDFGGNGGRPSHPELLDWLACEFVKPADGSPAWSVKHLHRLILASSTYRQSGRHPDAKRLSAKDPGGRLLWHVPRRRLAAEELRDAMLAVAGRLNPKAGGPGVVVPVDADLTNQLYAPSQWVVTADRAEHDRRSLYLLAKRNLRLPFMAAFDQPDAAASCARRESSTHALQALELLNGTLANDLAGSFAARLEKEAGADDRGRVERAFRLAVGRPPTPREAARSLEFLRTQPLREFALAVFNLNAFLYVE